MATRFYLSSTATTPVTPDFAAWTRTTEGLRRAMSPTKDASVMTSTTIWANAATAANESALARQFVSEPLAEGISFLTTHTIKCYIRCMESGTNDNINRQPICVKVVSEDGTIIRATLKALGHIGPNTTEWVSLTLTNKTLADGDTLDVNYTTKAGDRLVIEVGGQASAAGGASVTGTMSFGSDSATDLGENETDTAANNPWFEISTTVVIQTVYISDIIDFGTQVNGTNIKQNGFGLARKDLSTDSNPLRVVPDTTTDSSITYTKGIGGHSDFECWVPIPAGVVLFAVSVGMDYEVRGGSYPGNLPNASTNFLIYTRPTTGSSWVLQYDSGTMTAQEPVKDVVIPIYGQSDIQLFAEGGGDLSFDHCDWCNARFIYGVIPHPKPQIIQQAVQRAATR